MDNHSRRRGNGATAGPGSTIRLLRQQLGLTLRMLSERTGLAISTLSKLEKGNASLSFDKLQSISAGLGVDMVRILEPSQSGAPTGSGRSSSRRVIQRAGEGLAVDTHCYRQRFMATELLSKRFTPLVAELRARTIEEFTREFGGLIRHPGEEFFIVLEGEVEFHSETYAPVRLARGDTMYFDSDMGHAYLAAADGPCRVLAVCAGGDDQRMIDTFVECSEARRDVPSPASRDTPRRKSPAEKTPASRPRRTSRTP